VGLRVRDVGFRTLGVRLTSTLTPDLSVGANTLFKLKHRNRTRLVQKPNWTRMEGQK